MFGAQGFGKTSLAREWMLNYEAEAGRRAIRGLDPNGQFLEFKGMKWDPLADTEYPIDTATRFLRDTRADVKRGKFSGLLVFDDADFYWGPRANATWQQFFISFRHWRCDWFASARRPQEVPKISIASAKTLILFRVREPHGRKYLEQAADAPDLFDDVPTEPFKYLRYDMDTGEKTLGKTKKIEDSPRRRAAIRWPWSKSK